MSGLAIAILAGGAATRMGGAAKPYLVVGGRRLIDRQLEVLRPLAGELWLVTNDQARDRGLGLPMVSDETPGQGPLAGVLAALEAARADRVLVVACDMPQLTPALLALVAAPALDADLVVPVAFGRAEPLCARYSRACAPVIRDRLAAGLRQAQALAGDPRLRVHRIDEAALRAVDPELKSFRNCNRPEDL